MSRHAPRDMADEGLLHTVSHELEAIEAGRHACVICLLGRP
jgi:hypothetical protein